MSDCYDQKIETLGKTAQVMPHELMERAARLEGFAAQDPNNSTLLLDLAGTYHLAGKHALALATLDRWTEPADSQLSDLRGQVLLALGRWQDAEQLFEAALAGAPDSPALAFNLGYAAWASGKDRHRAVKLLWRATQLEPSNVHFHYHHAMALEVCGDSAGAGVALDQGLSVEPDHLKCLAMLGRLHLDAGDFAAASGCALRCTTAHPASAVGWQLKGQISLFQMDAQSASKNLRHAMAIDSEDVDTYIFLAQASFLQGRVRHARQLLSTALAIDGDDDVALCMLGWACMADNDMPAATAAFDEALGVSPESADAFAGSACLQLSSGNLHEADRMAQQALSMDQEHIVARLIMAQVREANGQALDAKLMVESVLKNSPFGPLRTSVSETLKSAATNASSGRLQRRYRRAVTSSTQPKKPRAV